MNFRAYAGVSLMSSKRRGNVVRLGGRRPRKKRRIGGLVVVCLAIFLTAWAFYPIKDRLEQENQLADYKRKIDSLNTENASLKKEIERLKTDEYVEQLARKDLGLAKPGEEVFLVYGADEQSKTIKPPARPKAEESKSLWERILRLFGR